MFLWVPGLLAQNVGAIKLKKEPGFFLLFQKGPKSDTISANNHNLFYFLVPDTLKESISLNTENGQIVATSNDSLVKLNYLHGLRYEYYYESEKKHLDFKQSNTKTNHKKTGAFKTFINGTSNYTSGKILLQVYNKLSGVILYEQVYWYMP